MHFGIHLASAHHCPEHERSVATDDAMKSKSSKNNYSTISYKNFHPPSFFDLSHPFRGTGGFSYFHHISTP